jgi:hypothetical protein
LKTESLATYVLDTNVFIEAHRRYYSIDLCHGFWDCLMHYCQEPRLLSIDRVLAEIDKGDALHQWVVNAPEDLFASTADADVVNWFGQMMIWVQANPQFRGAAKAKFAGDADGWVIAYAKAKGFVVVTHEVFDPNAKKRVPMPNVCQQFGVPYVDTFEMLRALKVKFGWAREAL